MVADDVLRSVWLFVFDNQEFDVEDFFFVDHEDFTLRVRGTVFDCHYVE